MTGQYGYSVIQYNTVTAHPLEICRALRLGTGQGSKAQYRTIQDRTGQGRTMQSGTRGVKQGCLLSPMFVSFVINGVAVEMSQWGKHGKQLIPGALEYVSSTLR